MLTLVTGEPGGSKTLNTIKMVNEGSEYKNRPIYHRGITGLKLDWKELTDEQCLDWESLPEGSVIVIDEAQHIYKKRSNSSQMPPHIMAFSTHRHKGFDFFIITQNPILVDHDLRKFVNRHYHYERPFNTNIPRRLQFQKCANDPTDYHARQEALVDKVKLDKKYFDLYKSAEIHTHKAKLPAKVYLIGLLMIAVIAGGFHLANRLMSRYKDPELVPVSAGQTSIVNNAFSTSSNDDLSYEELWKPRVSGLPHTAPVYDKLNEPKQRPMPNCVVFERTGDCMCYTQQATKMDVPFDICHNIVANGYFDPAKPLNKKTDRRIAKREMGGEQASAAAAEPHRNNVYFIPDNNYPNLRNSSQ